MIYITCAKNGRSCKTTNRKTSILPTLSKQMYKRKVQTLSGASFESTTCSKLKTHIPSYIVQEKHFQEYKKIKNNKTNSTYRNIRKRTTKSNQPYIKGCIKG